MQTLLVHGTNSTLKILRMSSPELVSSLSLLGVQSNGDPKSRSSSPCPRWKLNALLSAMAQEMFFTFFICWKNSKKTTLILICQLLKFMPSVVRTTPVVWRLHRHPSCTQEQSTLQSNVITFYHMSKPRKTQVGCSICNGFQPVNNKLTFSQNPLVRKILSVCASSFVDGRCECWKRIKRECDKMTNFSAVIQSVTLSSVWSESCVTIETQVEVWKCPLHIQVTICSPKFTGTCVTASQSLTDPCVTLLMSIHWDTC